MIGSFFIVIGILAFMLTVSIICYMKLNDAYSKLHDELTDAQTKYRNALYDYCALANKIDKIKALNVLDYENNEYHRELLTTEIN